jgi:hypothetical protein
VYLAVGYWTVHVRVEQLQGSGETLPEGERGVGAPRGLERADCPSSDLPQRADGHHRAQHQANPEKAGQIEEPSDDRDDQRGGDPEHERAGRVFDDALLVQPTRQRP